MWILNPLIATAVVEVITRLMSGYGALAKHGIRFIASSCIADDSRAIALRRENSNAYSSKTSTKSSIITSNTRASFCKAV
jgi:hypothetical protein